MSTTYIDDQDLTRVAYNGTWIRGGTPHEYAGTVASSTHAGDSFAVSFKGTSITAFGTIDATSGGVVTTYSVDGAPPANVTASAGSGDTFQQQFWKSPTLSVGQHRLLVTLAKVNSDPEPGEGTVWFDYFAVFDPTIVSSTSSSIASATSSSSPSVVTVSNNVAVGAIVGGIIGGLFIMFAILLAVILCLRQRDRKRKMKSSKGDIASDSTIGTRRASIRPSLIDPFILGQSDAMTARENKPTTDPATITSSSATTPPSSKAMTHRSSGSNGGSSEAPRIPAAGPSIFWGPSPIVVRPEREENDRPSQSAPSNAVDAPTVDMPPTYTPT